MGQNKFLRLLALGAYLILMIISTWATVESARRLLPGWNIIPIWAITIIFFTAAAYGTKLIALSFNKSVRVERRFPKLIAGIILLLVFWVSMILPTNTHTFFYTSIIKDVTVEELKFTEGKLKDLLNKGEAGKIIDQEKKAFEAKSASLFSNYAAEINNPGRLGNGERADNVLIKLQELLGGDIQRLILKSGSLADRRAFLDAMQAQVKNLVDQKLSIYDNKLYNINRGLDQNEIASLLAKIQSTESRIQAFKEGRFYGEEAKQVAKEPTDATRATLISSFQIIGKYSDDLKKLYPQTQSLLDYRTPKIVELENVLQVWKNFFRGDYKNKGFVFWIIIAMLIDLAGFIMFSIAFKNEE